MSLESEFQRYFDAMERSGGEDRCWLCRRSPAEVKRFFGFDEDGHPLEAAEHGIEDVVFERADVMSYRGTRPVCAICQLNMDAIVLMDEVPVWLELGRQMRTEREDLWPDAERG